jgi:D-threonate/D-erythronate kinase
VKKEMRFLIIADDLTGANDTGVQFAKVGFETLSLLSYEENESKPDAEVLVFNTETRSLDSDKAYKKMKAVADSLVLSNFSLVYKKIDSTLRGNIGAEIDALLDCELYDLAIVLPAYPKKGRITIGGYHVVNGSLVEDSEISRDPKNPVAESHLPTLIGRQSRRGIAHVDIGGIRKNQIFESLKDFIDKNQQIIVFDSFTQNDLETVTDAVLKSGVKVLWVGSAGLAESLSKVYKAPAFGNKNKKIKSKASCELPILTIAGSVSVVTRQQINALIEQRDCRLIISNPVLLVNDSHRRQEIARLTAAIIEVIEDGASPVLTSDVSEHVMKELHSFKVTTGKSSVEIGSEIAESLGEVGASVLAQQAIGGLILTGGDIAYSTCEHLGVKALRIIDEVEEGIPLCEVIGNRLDGLPLVTKAGAFGNKESLVNAMNKIQSLTRG